MKNTISSQFRKVLNFGSGPEGEARANAYQNAAQRAEMGIQAWIRQTLDQEAEKLLKGPSAPRQGPSLSSPAPDSRPARLP